MWELIAWVATLIFISVVTIMHYKNLKDKLAKEEYVNIATNWMLIASCIINIARILIW